MRKTRAIAVTALVAGLTLAVAAPASGHGVSYARGVGGSFIPAEPAGPPFTAVTGKVTSPKLGCRKSSRVIVFKQATGQDINYGSRLTTRSGAFTIPSPGTHFDDGGYYLVVKRKVLRNNRFHRHVCPRLETGSFTVTNS